MKQLEVRAYERQEIAEIMGLKVSSHNFIRDVRIKLERWGYTCETPRGGAVIITHKPETAEERLQEIMYRLFGLDTQIGKNGEMENGTTAFACFLYFMMTEEIAETMPWAERYAWMQYNFDLTIKYPCLERWTARLIQNDIMNKSTSKDNSMWWMTYRTDGVKHREPVDDDDPTLKEYLEERAEYYRDIYQKVNGNESTAWAITTAHLSKKYHCTYYQCKRIEVNGITNEEINMVLELIEEIVEAHGNMLMSKQQE